MMKIWNGELFLEVSDAEGKKLVEEDKAQDIEQVLRDGDVYKFRADFKGYQTRQYKPATKTLKKKVSKKKTTRKKANK